LFYNHVMSALPPQRAAPRTDTRQYPDQDLTWLTNEARNDAATAQQIIEAFAERVQMLQRQTDELRAENALLKRTGGQQTTLEQVQRLKANLRDFRNLAVRKALDRDVISMLSFTGHGVQLAAPAPMEQTLSMLTSPEEPISTLKPVCLAGGTWFGSLMVVTSNVRLSLVNGLSLRYSEALDWRDARPITGLGLGRAERVEAICTLDELRPPRHMMLVTRQGWVRVMSWLHTETVSLSGQSMTLPGTGDTPVWLGPCDTDGDVLLLTRYGRWTRFPIGMIPSIGCAGISLEQGDDVISAVVLDKHNPGSAMWFVSADGSVFAIASDGLAAHKKPGAKSTAITRKYVGLACFAITTRKTEFATLLSNAGDLHVVSMKGLPIAAKPADVQPLQVAGQRLIAATLKVPSALI
jgi:DNA gyrase/topoisomerase IV subunit A